MNGITIIIIDKQAFFRAGMHQALSQQSEFKILDCDPAQEPLELIEANSADVALLDIDFPALSGLELSRRIARRHPNTRVVILSPNHNDEELFEVIKTGAVAYLNKNTTAEELVNIISRACRGEYPINDSLIARPKVAEHVLKQFQDIVSMGKTMETLTAPLTHRETQILNYVAEGNSNKQIARILEISEQTIKNHVSSILRKLNANDRAHAVALAMRNGWILVEEKL
ncbi:MAG TPA: response regulator transcription factor [Dehalococcoidia bacterium]|jgi:two-component system response regulator DegU|nr:response regulator transcription factor [Dehalococcoidia bacterium]